MGSRQIEVFRDVDDTLPGEEWWQRLQSLIAAADTVVFLYEGHAIYFGPVDQLEHSNHPHIQEFLAMDRVEIESQPIS